MKDLGFEVGTIFIVDGTHRKVIAVDGVNKVRTRRLSAVEIGEYNRSARRPKER